MLVSHDGCGRRDEVRPLDEKPPIASGESESAWFEKEEDV